MNQRLARLIQLFQLKVEETRQAYLKVVQAREQFEQSKLRHNQLLGYRQDYVSQLESLGKEGASIERIRIRLDFINNLDKALIQLNGQLAQLARVRVAAELKYKQIKISEEGVGKLIERVRQGEEMKVQRMEQKESDEYAQKQWYSKNNNDDEKIE